MRRQPIQGGASVPTSRFLSATLFQINRRATGGRRQRLGNGINHATTKREILRLGKTELLNLGDTFFTSTRKDKWTSFSCQPKGFLENWRQNAGRGRFWKPPDFLPVALPVRLSLDLNISPTPEQLGLHRKSSQTSRGGANMSYRQ